MLSAFGRVIKTADLRRKLLFTLGMIVLYRMGTFIPAPGISYGTVQQCLNANQTHGGAYDIINLFTGVVDNHGARYVYFVFCERYLR